MSSSYQVLLGGALRCGAVRGDLSVVVLYALLDELFWWTLVEPPAELRRVPLITWLPLSSSSNTFRIRGASELLRAPLPKYLSATLSVAPLFAAISDTLLREILDALPFLSFSELPQSSYELLFSGSSCWAPLIRYLSDTLFVATLSSCELLTSGTSRVRSSWRR